ncbi:hypothetical protein C0J52_10927 [Blattella germanica]|nr:hypothetical protein C0J52_10927 [Blattella germanica]
MNVQRHHLSHDDMFRAIGIIENGGTQADAARVLNTGKGVISRMWSRYREFGSPAERHPGKSRVTTAAQDRFLHLRALRDRTSTENMLRSALQNVENVTVTTQTVRNRLHERGLNARRPLRCPAIRYGNRAPRVLWCRQHEDWTDNHLRTMNPRGLDPHRVRFELRRALDVWAQNSKLTFREVNDDRADILVFFEKGYHGDGYPFDGPGQILAHAFFPGGGRGGDAHFDEEESWLIRTSLFAVAAHEFGHSLGLSHSSVQGALMFPWYQGLKPNFQLPDDDRTGIQQLYGPKDDGKMWGPNPSYPERYPPYNPYPPQPQPPTYRPPVTRPTPRTERPTRYPPRTTPYPQRPETLPPTHHPKTRKPHVKHPKTEKPDKPDTCDTSYDAISVIRREVFIFKGRVSIIGFGLVNMLKVMLVIDIDTELFRHLLVNVLSMREKKIPDIEGGPKDDGKMWGPNPSYPERYPPYNPYPPQPQPPTYRPPVTRPTPRTERPTRYPPRTTPYPQRPETLPPTHHPKTRKPHVKHPKTEKPDKPDTCDTSYDAISVIRREVFIFKGRYIWRIGDNGLYAGYPAETHRMWNDLPKNYTHIDAVYERGDKKIVFFIGKKYYLYNGNQLEWGYPKPLTYLGLPESLEKVDGAMIWGHNGKTYFFSGTMYWK